MLKSKSKKSRFAAIAKAYGMKDPEKIKQKIMWGYIHLLVKTLVTPGLRPQLDHHAEHYEICDAMVSRKKKNPV